MNDIKGILSSPVWWISVVVVGILIHVLSSYLRTLLDTRLSKLSKNWRMRSEKRKRAFEDFVQSLIGKPNQQILELIDSTRQLIYSAIYAVFSAIMMLSLSIIKFPSVPRAFVILIGASSILALCFVMAYVFKSSRTRSGIVEAVEREKSGEVGDCSNKMSIADEHANSENT